MLSRVVVLCLFLICVAKVHAASYSSFQDANVPPTIIDQVELTTIQDQPLTLGLSDLVVNDPDDSYPDGFTLIVNAGENYTVSETTVTPAIGYTGLLTVPVQVHDGDTLSALFNLSITVEPKPVNQPPVIIGQTTLQTVKNQPINVSLANLSVTDPDDTYPTDFTLTLQPGLNYTVTGTTVTPAVDFVGSLQVGATVSDGENVSNTWPLLIEVANVEELLITGQKPLQLYEDSVLVLDLSHLVVNDPGKTYPAGFTLIVGAEANYTVDGNQITPAANFSGNLVVPVRVSNGTLESNTFNLLVTVVPVNDPPLLDGIGLTSLAMSPEGTPVRLAADATITDPDNDILKFAEVGFVSGYQMGSDALAPGYTSALIRSVFDPANGTLFLIGDAPLSEYAQVMRSIEYRFTSFDSVQALFPKQFYFLASDGTTKSDRRNVVVNLSRSADLDIPTVFTPNNDNANDTWRIRASNGSDLAGQLSIRVYNKKGFLVFEANGLSQQWDGKINGQLLPPDTYFYTIELNTPSQNKNLKGIVTILH